MSTESRDSLKGYFQTGDRPTKSEFEELINDTVNRIDDKATDVEAENSSIDDKYITPKTAKKSVEKFAPVKKVNGVLPNATTGDVVVGMNDIDGLQTSITNIENDVANKQDNLVSGNNIKTINGLSLLGNGNIQIDQATGKNVLLSDFIVASSSQGVFSGIAISSGTSTMGIFEQNHPGIMSIRKTVAGDSGYCYAIGGAVLKLYSGLKCNIILKTNSNQNNRTIRFGFEDSNNLTQPGNGVYFEIVNGNITSNAVTGTSNKTTFSLNQLSNNTWYHLRISVVSTSEIKYEIFNDAGVLMQTHSITTNIPTIALNCNVVGVGLGATSATEVVILIDYMDVDLGSPIRGDL